MYKVSRTYNNGLVLSGRFDKQEDLEKFTEFLDNYKEKGSETFKINYVLNEKQCAITRKYKSINELSSHITQLEEMGSTQIVIVKD